MNNLWLLFNLVALYCIFTRTDNAAVGETTGQCPYKVSVTKYYVTSLVASREIVYYTRCWSWDLRCTRKRTETYTVYKRVSVLSEETRYRPCPEIVTECPFTDCTNQCDKCAPDNTDSCIQPTGICLCKPGWRGNSCNETCDPGFYGSFCTNQCLCNSNGTVSCNPITGVCNCKPGWMEPYCHEEFQTEQPHYVGNTTVTIGLTEAPSQSPLYTTINESTPLTPSQVGKEETGFSYSDPGVMAGFIIIILVVVSAIIAVIVVVTIYKRRHDAKKAHTNNQTDEEEVEMARLQSENTNGQDTTDNHVYSDITPRNNVYTDVVTQLSTSLASLRSRETCSSDHVGETKSSRGNLYVDLKSSDCEDEDEGKSGAGGDAASCDEVIDTYQVVSGGTSNGNDRNQTPRSVELEKSYMDMSGGSHSYDTPRLLRSRDNSREELYTPVGSPDKGRKQPATYASLYKTPRPIPQYADIDIRQERDSDHSVCSTDDERDVYNKIDRTGRSYREGSHKTLEHYDNVESIGSRSPVENTYDHLSRSGDHGDENLPLHPQTENGHIESTQSPDRAYDKLDHSSVRSKRHGYKHT